MAHRNARLTEFGRLLLVQRVTELGWPPAQAAEALGVSRATAYKWLARYRQHGPAGLADGSSRPHRCPTRSRQPGPPGAGGPAAPTPGPPSAQLPPGHAPLDHLWGAAPPWHEPAFPHRPAKRRGGPLPAGAARGAGPPGGQEAGADPRRWRPPGPRPGGGHPAGPGHRLRLLHSAVDDRSRVAFSQILPDETATTAARFLVEAARFFAEHGVRIQRVLTDNAKAYAESFLFAETAAGLGIRRKRTRRYRPQTNGKGERFNKTLLDEWADGRLYRSNTERRRAVTRWLRLYNHRRPHTSLDGLTPMAVLVNNVHGKHT